MAQDEDAKSGSTDAVTVKVYSSCCWKKRGGSRRRCRFSSSGSAVHLLAGCESDDSTMSIPKGDNLTKCLFGISCCSERKSWNRPEESLEVFIFIASFNGYYGNLTCIPLFCTYGGVHCKIIIWLPDEWVLLMRKHWYVTRLLTCEVWPYNAPNLKPRRARIWTKQISRTADDFARGLGVAALLAYRDFCDMYHGMRGGIMIEWGLLKVGAKTSHSGCQIGKCSDHSSL